MDLQGLVTLTLQWDTLGDLRTLQLLIGSDTCIPYDNTQTLWRVINDFDVIARVPFTPCTLFNGGVGEQNHLLMTNGMAKVPLSDPRC